LYAGWRSFLHLLVQTVEFSFANNGVAGFYPNMQYVLRRYVAHLLVIGADAPTERVTVIDNNSQFIGKKSVFGKQNVGCSLYDKCIE